MGRDDQMCRPYKCTTGRKASILTLSKINGDDRKPISVPNITPDAIAHQLLLNGKPDQNCKIHKQKCGTENRHPWNHLGAIHYLSWRCHTSPQNSKAWITSIMKWSNASDQPHGFGSWIWSMTALNTSPVDAAPYTDHLRGSLASLI